MPIYGNLETWEDIKPNQGEIFNPEKLAKTLMDIFGWNHQILINTEPSAPNDRGQLEFTDYWPHYHFEPDHDRTDKPV